MFRRGGDHVTVELARMQGTMTSLTEQVHALTVDHEARIRRVERWTYALPVATFLAVASALAGILRG